MMDPGGKRADKYIYSTLYIAAAKCAGVKNPPARSAAAPPEAEKKREPPRDTPARGSYANERINTVIKAH